MVKYGVWFTNSYEMAEFDTKQVKYDREWSNILAKWLNMVADGHEAVFWRNLIPNTSNLTENGQILYQTGQIRWLVDKWLLYSQI